MKPTNARLSSLVPAIATLSTHMFHVYRSDSKENMKEMTP